jgi:carboxylesterase
MPVMPGAEPYESAGGPTGALLVHGFTGTPQSLRPWAEHLAAAGLSVWCPLLPGHGTRWQDMNRTSWHDWYAAADAGLARLRARCDEVFALGLSMGGTLVLRLAEQHGPALAGTVVVNASLGSENRATKLLPVVSRLVPSIAGVAGDVKAPGVTELAYARTPLRAAASLARLWRVTSADLGRIASPVLAYRSRLDHVVEPLSGRLLTSGVPAGLLREQVLENSYHVATLDNDKETIFSGSLEFIRSHSRVRADP